MDYPKKWKCPNCFEIVENNKVCTKCKFKFGNHYPKLWNCPVCSNLNSDSEFCKICEYPNNLSFPKLWHCYECGNLVKDSAKCDVCGFELWEKNIQPAQIIEKKAIRKDFMDSKNIYLMSIGIIILSLILVFYSIDYSPGSETISEEIFAGQVFSRDFILATNLDSVSFEILSPLGEKIIIAGEKKSQNIWSIVNVSLNESGIWNILITGTLGLSSFQVSDSLEIKALCVNSSGCLSGICCSGACINSCVNNSECNDNNPLTYDACLFSGTCNAKCSNPPLVCSTISRDGYCPSSCNRDNDVDCVSCAKDEAVCNYVCKKIECESNADCFDNSPLTVDKCIIMNDECQNYCENNYYEGSCADEKIEYNGYCITPSCLTSNDCYKYGWNYNCLNPATIDAYCSYFRCNSNEILCFEDGLNKCKVPACKNDLDCPAGQACENAWECNARCH